MSEVGDSEIILDKLFRIRERLPTRIFHVSEDAASVVANEVATLIRVRAAEKKNATLCFSVGSVTPMVCDKLIAIHKNEGLSFNNVVVFVLDEYLPVKKNQLQSHARFMREVFFDHVDLKPENILMTATGHLVLTDFDLSKGSSTPLTPQVLEKAMLHTEPGIVTNSFVGTEEYIAPEVIKGFGHTSAVDWWTFGILLFELLFGTTPFRGRTRDDTFGHILGGELKFPDRTAYAPISRQCKDLIQHLLHPLLKKILQ